MLGFLKKKSVPRNRLFLITVKIGRGTNVDMPFRMTGACVPVFAPGTNHEVAAKSAVLSLVSKGFEFLDIQGRISELDATQWDSYVREIWPEFSSHFPDQRAVLAKIEAGDVFYGPFAGYETSD